MVAQVDWGAEPISRFAATDHLGSTRFLLGIREDLTVAGEELLEYYPFGGFKVGGPIADATHLFTGHERDQGSGSTELDYMHARYYSSGLGRFLSVDPVGGKVGSSQSWNRYSYVMNNPLNMIDPTGMMNDVPNTMTGGAFGKKPQMTASQTPEQKLITAGCLGPLLVTGSFAAAASVPAVGPSGALLGLSSAAVVSTVEQAHSGEDIGEMALNVTTATSLGTLSSVMPGKGVADTLGGAVVATAVGGAASGNVDAQSTASQVGSVTNAGFAHLASAGSPSVGGGKAAVLRATFQTSLEVLKTEFLETPSMQETLSEIDETSE